MTLFQVVLDGGGGGGGVRWDDMAALAQQCSLFSTDVAAAEHTEIKDALLKLAAYMLAHDMSAKEVFRQFDSTGRGLLDAAGLRALFAQLLPALTHPELEALVAKWKAMSFQEVQKAMQWVTVKRAKAQKRLLDGGERLLPPATTTRVTANWAVAAAAAATLPAVAWVAPSLPESKRLTTTQWPPRGAAATASSSSSSSRAEDAAGVPKKLPRGHSRSGSRVSVASAADEPSDGALFMEALHAHMSRTGHTLRQLFDALDEARRGYLELAQLGPMVALAFPQLAPCKHRYFQAMLSSAASGRVTAKDVARCADDCVRLDYDLRARGRVVVKDVLFKLCQFALAGGHAVPQLLGRWTHSGAIDTVEDADQMLREVLPALTTDERAALASKWAAMSGEELHHSMKWVAARLAKARKAPASHGSTTSLGALAS